MKPYTAGDGSTLPKELFNEDWYERQEFVRSLDDLESLRAVLLHEPDWAVRASAFSGIDRIMRARPWSSYDSTDAEEDDSVTAESLNKLVRFSALHDPDWRVRLLAVLRSHYDEDEATLRAAAACDECEAVRRAAVDIVRELIREHGESEPDDKWRQKNDKDEEHLIYADEKLLPVVADRHRFFVDFDSVCLRSASGQELLRFYPEFEANRSTALTGQCWLDLRDMILQAEKTKRALKLTDTLSFGGRSYSAYYFRITPLRKGMTEFCFLECSSGCHESRKRDCGLRDEWEFDADALMNKCDGFYKQCRIVLPYAELHTAALDAVVRNEAALISLEREHISRWEDEEIADGTRQ